MKKAALSIFALALLARCGPTPSTGSGCRSGTHRCTADAGAGSGQTCVGGHWLDIHCDPDCGCREDGGTTPDGGPDCTLRCLGTGFHGSFVIAESRAGFTSG